MLSIATLQRFGPPALTVLLPCTALWLDADTTTATTRDALRGQEVSPSDRLGANPKSMILSGPDADMFEILRLLPDEDCTFEINSETNELSIQLGRAAIPHLDIAPGQCPNKFDVVGDGDHGNDDDDDDDDDHDDDDDDHDDDDDDQGDDDDDDHHDDDDDHHGDDDDDGHHGGHSFNVASMLAQTLGSSVLGNGFDVTQTDLGSLQLTRSASVDAPTSALFGVAVTPMSFEFSDQGTPFIGAGCACHELLGDGKLDLNLEFDGDEVVQAFGLNSEATGTLIPLSLFGRTGPNRGFRIRDCIQIYNPSKP